MRFAVVLSVCLLSACAMQRSPVADLQAFDFYHCEGRGMHAVAVAGIFKCEVTK